MKNIVNELEKILNELKQIGYGDSEKPFPVNMSKINIDLNEIIESYLLLSKKEKESIQVSKDIGWILYCFGFEMATYALRSGDQRYFTNGLVALDLASDSDSYFDIRDILRLFALYWDVHKKKQLSYQPIFDLEDNFSKNVREFIIERKEDMKSLECMKWKIANEGELTQYYYSSWDNEE